MAESGALAAEAFGALLLPLLAPDARGLVLAVSGGPDSMALLHLLAACRGRIALPPVTVGTVDHGLRPGSVDDCALVEAAAHAHGLPVRRLTWTGPKPTRAVQERAREARYALLSDLCGSIGADHLVTAHTLDDQAETVLFRLLRGSGIAGLAAMRPVTMRGGLRHLRPLLGIGKQRLVATCGAASLLFRDDPANADPRFARARMRRLLPALAAETCDAAALARLATRAARAEEALALAADAAFRAASLPSPDGTLRLDSTRLAALPAELALRVVAAAIARASGTSPRDLDSLERLADRIVAAARHGAPLRATLGGTVLTLTPAGRLAIAREGPRRHPIPSPAQRDKSLPRTCSGVALASARVG